jgi:hypothetical protein
VGNVYSRRHPSSSLSCVTAQNDKRFFAKRPGQSGLAAYEQHPSLAITPSVNAADVGHVSVDISVDAPRAAVVPPQRPIPNR